MERYTKWSSQQSAEDDQEPYHCTPAYRPSDIICPGSDTEETPDETKAKRERYEDAARRYVAGERPMILSASLRGPLDEKSGWINPWRYRPRKPNDATWWQPGSENMLFTRENVMQRAAAYGLGYMTPKEALDWCKASAQAESQSQYGTEPRDSLLESIEEDEPEHPDDSEEEKTADALGDFESAPADDISEAQIGGQSSIANNCSTTPYTSEDQNGRARVIKRPVNTDWLKGSYPSKRARWDGLALSSPTPVAATNNHREQRRRKVQARQGASLLFSGIRSIQHDMPASRESLHEIRGLESSLRHAAHRMSFHSSGSGKSRFEGSTSFPHQQTKHLDEPYDELYDINSNTFCSQRLQTKSQSSPRDAEDQSMSDLEPDELVATPASKQNTASLITCILSSSRTSNSSSNKLPKLPRATTTSHRHDVVNIEDDSFVTEVAPSSRDLDKFIFKKKKKRRIHKAERLEDFLDDHRQRDKQYIDSASRNMPLIAPVDGEYSNSSPSPEDETSQIEEYLDQPLIDEEVQHAKSDRSYISQGVLEYANANLSFDEMINGNSVIRSLPTKPLAVGKAKNPGISQQKGSFLIHSSLITQPKDRRSFLKLPRKPEAVPKTVEDAIEPQVQSTQSKVVPGNAVRKYPSFQDPNDISTQSYNTTPAEPPLLQIPSKPPLSIRRTPKLARLLRFSFENTFGGSLFSPITGSRASHQEVLIGKIMTPEQGDKRSHDETFIRNELRNYQLYIKRDIENKAEGSQDNPILDDTRAPAAEDGVMAEEEHSGDAMDQIQKSLSQNCPCISNESSTRSSSPQEIGELAQATGSQAHQKGPTEPDHIGEMPAPISPEVTAQVEQQNIQVLDQQAALDNSVGDGIDHKATLIQPETQETAMNKAKATLGGSPGSKCDSKTTPRQVEQQDAKMINLKESVDGLASDEIDRDATLRPFEHQNVTSTSLMSERASMSPEKEATPIEQSPFAQEAFSADSLVLKANSENHSFGATALSDEESESSWEGCGPQSPWALDTCDQLLPHSLNNNMNPRSPIRPLSGPDAMSAAPEKFFIEKQGVDMGDDYLTCIEPPRTLEDDEFGIVPFKYLMSASPAPVSRTPHSNELPPNTQQQFDAALKNPWTSSLKKPSSIRAKKRVSFDAMLPEDSKYSDDLEELREAPASPPPPEEELVNEHIIGGGFTRTAPFSNHFSAARTRKFTFMLPQNSQSPRNSSPPLSAQAEAFIAADRDAPQDQSRRLSDFESPTRHLKPRNGTNGNSQRKEWEEERSRLVDTSPRSSPPSRQMYSSSMANFDMEEALGQIDNFLEDWSVEAELKKARGISQTKETEENGLRRRRLFGLA